MADVDAPCRVRSAQSLRPRPAPASPPGMSANEIGTAFPSLSAHVLVRLGDDYLGVWCTMMVAMMLPSVTPMVLLFDRVSAERARRSKRYLSTWIFVASYLAVWTLYGLGAYALYRGLRALDLELLDWSRGGPYALGALLGLAGLYELTPLKNACLRQCRSPMYFVLGGWRDGTRGAVRMGFEHGTYCVGCCWGLMLVLFGLGAMSILWMAVIAALIFAQKVLPFGDRLGRMLALAFVASGIWIAAAPSSVPGLA